MRSEARGRCARSRGGGGWVDVLAGGWFGGRVEGGFEGVVAPASSQAARAAGSTGQAGGGGGSVFGAMAVNVL